MQIFLHLCASDDGDVGIGNTEGLGRGSGGGQAVGVSARYVGRAPLLVARPTMAETARA